MNSPEYICWKFDSSTDYQKVRIPYYSLASPDYGLDTKEIYVCLACLEILPTKRDYESHLNNPPSYCKQPPGNIIYSDEDNQEQKPFYIFEIDGEEAKRKKGKLRSGI